MRRLPSPEGPCARSYPALVIVQLVGRPRYLGKSCSAAGSPSTHLFRRPRTPPSVCAAVSTTATTTPGRIVIPEPPRFLFRILDDAEEELGIVHRRQRLKGWHDAHRVHCQARRTDRGSGGEIAVDHSGEVDCYRCFGDRESLRLADIPAALTRRPGNLEGGTTTPNVTARMAVEKYARSAEVWQSSPGILSRRVPTGSPRRRWSPRPSAAA